MLTVNNSNKLIFFQNSFKNCNEEAQRQERYDLLKRSTYGWRSSAL